MWNSDKENEDIFSITTPQHQETVKICSVVFSIICATGLLIWANATLTVLTWPISFIAGVGLTEYRKAYRESLFYNREDLFTPSNKRKEKLKATFCYFVECTSLYCFILIPFIMMIKFIF